MQNIQQKKLTAKYFFTEVKTKNVGFLPLVCISKHNLTFYFPFIYRKFKHLQTLRFSRYIYIYK